MNNTYEKSHSDQDHDSDSDLDRKAPTSVAPSSSFFHKKNNDHPLGNTLSSYPISES